MKLKSIGLTNFRGLERLDIDFDDKMTVIAGVNGVGKSSILEAIAIAFSHAMPEFTSSREKPLSLANTDIQQGKSSCSIEVESTELLAASLITWLFKESLGEGEQRAIEDRLLSMKKDLSAMEKGTPTYKNLKNEVVWAEKRLQGNFEKRMNWLFTETYETDARMKQHLRSSPGQPLVVYYSTKRFLSRLPPKLANAPPFKQAAAYTKSLNQVEVSLSDFAKWQRALFSLLVLRKNSEYGARILKSLTEAVTALLPDIKEFYFDRGSPPHYSVMKYATIREQVEGKKLGKRLSLEQLSDGERGLIALVFDLTRRLAIANPDSDNPIAEGGALVLIDEIELHLHPSWQRRVLRQLQKIFSQCQFVVTTHSPQVIGQARPAKLRLLYQNEFGNISLAPVSQSFGMDSSWILENIMGVPARDHATEQSLSAIFDAIDEDDFGKARKLANTLRADIGDFPDLQEALSLLDRLSLLRSE
ncbi:MAG: AAA family ATPase [Xanthomonadales bacterium]|nr:AAA family ATPase [Xanthomonadales bacterium]